MLTLSAIAALDTPIVNVLEDAPVPTQWYVERKGGIKPCCTAAVIWRIKLEIWSILTEHVYKKDLVDIHLRILKISPFTVHLKPDVRSMSKICIFDRSSATLTMRYRSTSNSRF